MQKWKDTNFANEERSQIAKIHTVIPAEFVHSKADASGIDSFHIDPMGRDLRLEKHGQPAMDGVPSRLQLQRRRQSK